MAIYSVTTSGVLQFAYTGLGNPVSTLTSEGISTSALASSPIAGNNAKIYTIGPPNFFTSSGGLSVVSVNLSTQSGLAASAIGEFPISGIVDNIPEIEVIKGQAAPGQTSSGNLVINGNTVVIRVRPRDSAGNIVIISNTVSSINLLEITTGNLIITANDTASINLSPTSAGNLVITGNSVTKRVRPRDSAGNLVITGNTVSQTLFNQSTDGNVIIIGNTVSQTLFNQPSAGNVIIISNTVSQTLFNQSTAGNVIISGNSVAKRVRPRDSAGNLVIAGNTVSVITLEPTSSGNLVVTDFGYSNSLFTGGIAGDPIGSQAIASGNQATPVTTQVSFYGDIESHGNLVIDPVGELVNSLSDSSGIAGAAQSSIPIGGGMDTIFRSTGYQTTLDFLTSGNLIASGSSKLSNDFESSGNLVISGTTVAVRKLDFLSNGNLVITGTDSQTSTRNEDSAGELVIDPVGEFIEPLSDSSGIAGASLADLPIGGGSDTTYSPTTYEDLWIVESSGNLLISGFSGFNNDYTSQGNLLISGTTVAVRELNFLSNGNLVVTGSSFNNRTIAEYSDGNLLIIASGLYEDTWLAESNGNLLISGSDIGVRTLNFITTGNLVISGTYDSHRVWSFNSSGNLVIDGSTFQSSLHNEDTNGNLVITPVGEFIEPLSDSSGIAGASLADLPIGGGSDTTYSPTTYEDLWIETTAGNLTLVGTDTYTSRRNELSNGNLVITGNDTQNSILNETTNGNLVIVGNTVAIVTVDFSSNGELSFTPVGWKSTATISGTIAGSALAGTPIGGDEMENNTSVVQVSYISGGTFYPGNIAYTVTNGNLLIIGTDTVEFVQSVTVDSRGNLIITGSTLCSVTQISTSSGELLISGNSTANISVIYPETTAGLVLLYGNTVAETTYASDSNGNLVITGTSVTDTAYTVDTNGNLIINGSTTSDTTHVVDTTGNLLIAGNSEISYTVSIDSFGNILINGYSGLGYAFASAGELLISGTTVSEYIPANQNNSSTGNLVITGRTTVEVIIVPPVQKQNAGGSYVFASSWDILKPYFPDDRHILGYVRGESNGMRRRKISGSTTFTVVRGLDKLTIAPKNYDFLRNLPKVVESPQLFNNSILKQILHEDQLLLDGQWCEFDLIDDELSYETK